VRLTRRQWLTAAGWIVLAWVVATPVVGVISLTIGLVTGLVVVLVPMYLLFSWMCLVAVAVCLAQGRGHRMLARMSAALLGPVPGLLVVAAYVRARQQCSVDPDPAGCFAYLDGSPLLVVLIVAVALTGLLAFVVAWLATGPRPDEAADRLAAAGDLGGR
jgi:hypothetical protein